MWIRETYVLPVMAAIFDLTLPETLSDIIHTSSAVLADLEKVGVAFGISLIYCIKAEILVVGQADFRDTPVVAHHL